MQFSRLVGLMFAGCLVAACDSGGSGGGGSGGNGGSGGSGGQTGCSAPADCAAPAGECEEATCASGACGVGTVSDGTPAKTQVTGDCKRSVCQAGAVATANDDNDIPDAAGDCTVDACSGGSPATTPEALGTACSVDSGKVCDAMGKCVGCNVSADCAEPTPACEAASHTCVTVDCMDAVKNGDETDVDCGGSCAPCDDAKSCLLAADCKSGVCTGDVCQAPTCSDAASNGVETGTDCGGADCPKCGPDEGCNSNEDCVGDECSGVGGTCTPNCADQTKNETESDVDCGGGDCPKCDVGGQCDALDTNCVDTAFCDAGTCATKKVKATPCAGANECASGHCADGICCVSACASTCFTCNGFDGPGNCGLVLLGTDPDNECNGNGGADVCNGDGACGGSNGMACSSPADCASALCADGVCCDQLCDYPCEACTAAKTGGADGVCAKVTMGIDPDSECVGSLTCNGNGSCSPKLTNGNACTVAGECQSNFCVDGICCNNICNTTCRACDNAGSVGTCSFNPAGTDPDNECGGGTPNCNGAGMCQ